MAETKVKAAGVPMSLHTEVIISYRLPGKGCFAFISHCFMSNCKISTFFTLSVFEMTPFQPLHLSVLAETIVTSHYSTAAQTIQCGGWKGVR